MTQVKSVAKWVLLGFLVYAIVRSPNQAADIVRTGFDIIAQGVTSIIAFFDGLLGR